MPLDPGPVGDGVGYAGVNVASRAPVAFNGEVVACGVAVPHAHTAAMAIATNAFLIHVGQRCYSRAVTPSG
jgi:uncharacterized Ntn-hydrolase superfamily protein